MANMNYREEQAKQYNLTEKESIMLSAFINELYAEEGFSDVSPQDLQRITGIARNSYKGVLGSLAKKNIQKSLICLVICSAPFKALIIVLFKRLLMIRLLISNPMICALNPTLISTLTAAHGSARGSERCSASRSNSESL